ncbi:MAG: alanine racemase [Cellulosilyticum sp.]|nr:alanine racemase [Cellulosilyticum sp.]
MNDDLLKPLTRWCEIDLDLLSHNITEAKKLISSKTKIMAVLKDHAYGHGDTTIAHEMEHLGIDFFAVSHIDEAMRLRNSGIKSDILILSYTSPHYFKLLSKYHLTQTLISLEYAKKLNDYGKTYHCQCYAHVKIDTGMHRLGLYYDGTHNTLEPILEIYSLPHLTITGTYTHYAVADSLMQNHIDYTKAQYHLFQDLINLLKKKGISIGALHTQNTSAILHYPHFQCDYIRVGTLLVGIPYGDITLSPQAQNFKSIFSLKSKVSIVKELPPNSKVSYGLNYTTSQKQRIAVVAIGYGDGYPRALSNKQVHVIIKGHLAEVIGNICMDQLIIDITSIPDVQEGDTVTLIGSADGYTISLDYIAQVMNTLSNEIVDHINPRVPRVYKKGAQAFIQPLTF